MKATKWCLPVLQYSAQYENISPSFVSASFLFICRNWSSIHIFHIFHKQTIQSSNDRLPNYYAPMMSLAIDLNTYGSRPRETWQNFEIQPSVEIYRSCLCRIWVELVHIGRVLREALHVLLALLRWASTDPSRQWGYVVLKCPNGLEIDRHRTESLCWYGFPGSARGNRIL